LATFIDHRQNAAMSCQLSVASCQWGKQKLPHFSPAPFAWPLIAAVTSFAAEGINFPRKTVPAGEPGRCDTENPLV
jgi:hypothetical protein